MKLSTKTQYGIRAMLELTMNDSGRPLSIKQIAERQGVPEPYLEQLMRQLKKSGLVVSTRGAQGGYALARTPDQISVGGIIRVLEGSLAPVSCLEEDHVCQNSDRCAMHLLYGRISRGITGVLESITLMDMAADQRKLNATPLCDGSAGQTSQE